MNLQITVSKSELLSKLKAVSRVINPSSKVIPAHANFLFEIFEEFKVTGADESGNITAVIDCDFEQPSELISCLVDYKTITEGLKELPEQPIQLQFHPAGKGFAIVLLYGSGKYNLSGIESDGFSVVKNTEESSILLNMPSADLLKGVKTVFHFAGVDELRPWVSNVYFELKSGKYTFCATDTHNLGMIEFQNTETEELMPDVNIMLPTKVCKLLIDIMPKECDLRLEINKKNVTIQFDQFKLIYRLTDAVYPNFRSIIPTNNDKVLLASTSNLISSIRRVSIFANKASSMIQLTPMERNLAINGRDIDIQQSAEENIPVDYTGEEFTIGLNSQLLLKCLEAIDSEDVKMTFSEPTKAALIIPDEEDAELTVLIMPLAINV